MFSTLGNRKITLSGTLSGTRSGIILSLALMLNGCGRDYSYLYADSGMSAGDGGSTGPGLGDDRSKR